MTYSIVAADPSRQQVGVAVQSKFLAVGNLVPWARGGVGACAVQAFPDVTVGPRALERLAAGEDPQTVLDDLVVADAMAAQRQTGLVAADGRAASHTGASCFDVRGSLTGPGYAIQGNVLSNAAVLAAMEAAFVASADAPLARRLLAALDAGQAAGGEKRGMESAALLVCQPGGGYGGNHDRLVDLRIDHDDQPLAALRRLLDVRDYYFERTPPSDWITLDEPLRGEIAKRLQASGWLTHGVALDDALMNYLGWENLEERWTDADSIDPVALAHLRRQLALPG